MSVVIHEIINSFKTLSIGAQKDVVSSLQRIVEDQEVCVSRREILDNKQGECPHCGHPKYVKFGTDKNARRYKCKSCNRSFTEYSGTWLAGLHRKDMVNSYITLMLEEKSLDKISQTLHINKKTAFDWRHKILSSLDGTDKNEFIGITESDETFFPFSEKGKKTLERPGRKRGGEIHKAGISDQQVAVIVTADRKKELCLDVATLGRIKKSDIESSIGEQIGQGTILCSDAHVSYKGFAIDHHLEHHTLKANTKEFVEKGIYHIQNINSLHNRLKRWISQEFWGVSTKYLQKYLNWFRYKEEFKNDPNFVGKFSTKVIENIKTQYNYRDTIIKYELLL